MNLDEVGVCCLQINNNVHKFRTNDSGRPISRRRNIISGPKNETKKKMKTKVHKVRENVSRGTKRQTVSKNYVDYSKLFDLLIKIFCDVSIHFLDICYPKHECESKVNVLKSLAPRPRLAVKEVRMNNRSIRLGERKRRSRAALLRDELRRQLHMTAKDVMMEEKKQEGDTPPYRVYRPDIAPSTK